MQMEHPLADLALARRLERTEGSANAAFVEARAAIAPEVGATWCEVDGTFVMFDGVASPLTQTFGLGLHAAPDDTRLEVIETFLQSRGAAVHHEVSPLADASVLPLLASRGYRPVELTTVLCQLLPLPPTPHQVAADGIGVRRVGLDEIDTWVETAALGWGESPELADFMRGLGAVTGRAEGTHTFLADRDGEPIAAGAMHIRDGVALLAGASTIPAARRHGAQAALLQARLRYAAVQGCDLAMMCAAPGSASQRNAERRGFRIAYTRIKWGREPLGA
jgi:GNAT superfamily N-acetyltransferase